MKSKFVFFTLIISALSCDDIVEKNITKSVVALRAPVDGYSTTIGQQTFWWDAVDGASKYQLTIAAPRVDSANLLVVDTVILKTVFKITLPQGKVQWCVKALNENYKTTYSCRFIEVTN